MCGNGILIKSKHDHLKQLGVTTAETAEITTATTSDVTATATTITEKCVFKSILLLVVTQFLLRGHYTRRSYRICCAVQNIGREQRKNDDVTFREFVLCLVVNARLGPTASGRDDSRLSLRPVFVNIVREILYVR